MEETTQQTKYKKINQKKVNNEIPVIRHALKWRDLASKNYVESEIVTRVGNLCFVRNKLAASGKTYFSTGFIYLDESNSEQISDVTTITDPDLQKDEAKMRNIFAAGIELQKAKEERKARQDEEDKKAWQLREKNLSILSDARSLVWHLQEELRELIDKSETLQGITSNKRIQVILKGLSDMRMLQEHFKIL